MLIVSYPASLLFPALRDFSEVWTETVLLLGFIVQSCYQCTWSMLPVSHFLLFLCMCYFGNFIFFVMCICFPCLYPWIIFFWFPLESWLSLITSLSLPSRLWLNMSIICTLDAYQSTVCKQKLFALLHQGYICPNMSELSLP